MSDIRLERDFSVSPARLFEVVTSSTEVVNWWCPEGFEMPDPELDFTQLGPWHAEMTSPEGKVFKVSGRVIKVEPPKRVGFTWGWHDEADQRSAESHVTFTVQKTAKGAKLVIDHRALPEGEAAADHTSGWGKMYDRIALHLSTTEQPGEKETYNARLYIGLPWWWHARDTRRRGKDHGRMAEMV